MTLIRTVAPTHYPISLVEAKSHINLIHSDWDAKLDQFIAAMTNYLDGATGYLGKAICRQTWEYYIDRFERRVSIPLPPLFAVDAVEYLNDLDVLTPLLTTEYQVVRGGDNPAYIQAAYGTSWPLPKCQPDAVRITFTAGWEQGRIPESIKQAMLMGVSYWNENRESFVLSAFIPKELPVGFYDLLDMHKITRI